MAGCCTKYQTCTCAPPRHNGTPARQPSALRISRDAPVLPEPPAQLQQYEAVALSGGLPRAASVRELHAMQRDLRRIERTIAPLQVLAPWLGFGAQGVQRTLSAAAAGALSLGWGFRAQGLKERTCRAAKVQVQVGLWCGAGDRGPEFRAA